MRRTLPIFVTAVIVNRRQSFCSATTTSTVSKHPYTKLQTKLVEIENLNGAKGLLSWDEMVLMQPGSSSARNDQNAALSAVIHEKQTSKELKDIIDQTLQADQSVLSAYDRANVRDALRDFTLAASKTTEQTMKEAELVGKGYQTWV